MNSLSVAKLYSDGTYKILYDCIETYEQADLLAQLAMCGKSWDDLIIILPGWNKSIDRKPAEYQMAIRLAEEYKAQNVKRHILK
jgi:hypothetical protein